MGREQQPLNLTALELMMNQARIQTVMQFAFCRIVESALHQRDVPAAGLHRFALY